MAMWRASWEMIKDRPFVGFGLSGFNNFYSQYKLDGHAEIPMYPHNIILSFWIETGLSGLIAFLAILSASVLEPRQRGLRNPSLYSYRLIALSMLVSFLVFGMVDEPYLKNDLAVMFWVMLGIPNVLGGISESRP